jgi:hypothetical protein
MSLRTSDLTDSVKADLKLAFMSQNSGQDDSEPDCIPTHVMTGAKVEADGHLQSHTIEHLGRPI